MSKPSGPVHLHIGRLVIDAAVLEGGVAPHELQARLQAALAPRFGAGEHDPKPPPSWADSVAGEIAARVRGSLPGTAT